MIMWKTGCKIAAILLSVLLVGSVINIGLTLLSEKSDEGFWGGVVLLVVVGMVVSIIVGDAFKKWKAKHPLFPLFVVVLAFLMLSACTRVNPGYVGIKVNYWGGDRGVDANSLVTGAVLYNPITTSVFEYPTFAQTAIWTHSKNEGSPTNEEISFNSKEGLVFHADISLTITLDGAKVPKFYEKFRSDDVTKFVHTFLRNVARDQFNEIAVKYTAEEIYGEKKEAFLHEVRERCNAEMGPYGVRIEQFGFVGAPRPPDNVTDAINNKIKATQMAIQAENELRQAKAEAQKMIAKADGDAQSRVKMAEGEAKANLVLAQSITPSLLQWRQLQITEDAVKKWNGERPMVEGANSGLLLNINPK